MNRKNCTPFLIFCSQNLNLPEESVTADLVLVGPVIADPISDNIDPVDPVIADPIIVNPISPFSVDLAPAGSVPVHPIPTDPVPTEFCLS